MRYFIGLVCALALSVMPMLGCSETTGDGGSGGMAGSGGSAGSGGNGGSGGTTGQAFPCNEQGIRDAIAEGGGPHTFDCDGPTTVGTPFDIHIDNDVILDGEGVLTIEQQEPPNSIPFAPVFFVESGIIAELRGLSVTGGGFTYGGGGIENQGNLTLTNSAVFGNDGASGGVANSGTLVVVNSTVSGNQALHQGSEVWNMGVLKLINSTLFGASEDGVVGIHTTEGGTVTLVNSIVVGACSKDLGGVVSGGYNIESPGDTCGFDQEGDQSNVSTEELALEPLADNGGPKTHALLPGSVAIDLIPEAVCLDAEGEPLTGDQRGVTRPQGDSCDVGAFELEVGP